MKTPMLSRRLFIALTGGALASPDSWGVDVPAALDHILLGSSDLDQGIAFVKEHTGVAPAFGGVHPGRGTRNALLSLGDRHCLEIIAPEPRPAQHTPYIWPEEAHRAEPRGLGCASRWSRQRRGPPPCCRNRLRRPLAWRAQAPGRAHPPVEGAQLGDDHAGLLPFFIEWSADTIHPSADAPPGCKILRFELSAPDDTELRRTFTLIGLDVRVAHGDTPRLLARIGGVDGKVMTLVS
jgi:Glyoxalase-like domain